MVGEAEWSLRAQSQLGEYMHYLAEHAPALAAEAASELKAFADQLVGRPGLARPARWEGLFERSARRWKKILVLDIGGGTVRVVALLDMRQDLSVIDPLSK